MPRPNISNEITVMNALVGCVCVECVWLIAGLQPHLT